MSQVPALAEIVLADDPTRWRDAGFFVDAEGACNLGTIQLRLVGSSGGLPGVLSWTLSRALWTDSYQFRPIDGIATFGLADDHTPNDIVLHPNGALGIYSVLVRPSLKLPASRVHVHFARHTGTAHRASNCPSAPTTVRPGCTDLCFDVNARSPLPTSRAPLRR